jgi:cytoskeletal protein RodZ
MPSVAEQLRQAREQQNLSIHEVAEATKIRTDYIRALEEGKYAGFAAPIYIRGFVRSYATLLRMDGAQMVRELDTELAGTKEFQERPSLTGRSQGPLDLLMLQFSKINWRLVLPVLVLVVVVVVAVRGYRMWQSYQTRDPLADLGPGLYQPGASGDTLPLPTNSAPR